MRDKRDNNRLKVFSHGLSCCDNVWMDFKSMHNFCAETMLGQTLCFFSLAKPKGFFTVLVTKKPQNKHKVYAEEVSEYGLCKMFEFM